jgi:hypothetical protein
LSNVLEQQEANMTFHFHSFPGAAVFLRDDFGWENPPRRRVRLIARWQRGADGQLKCRWRRQQTNFPPDY